MRLSELRLSAVQFLSQGKYFRIAFGRKFLWMEHISNTANETLARISELYPFSDDTTATSPNIHDMHYASHLLWFRGYTHKSKSKNPDDTKQMCKDSWKYRRVTNLRSQHTYFSVLKVIE
jgi:hypothetical protein